MVWYCVSPAGTVTLIGPKPNEPSWNVDQSRFGSSCSVTVTSWAATLPSFSKSMVYGERAGGMDEALRAEAGGADEGVGVARLHATWGWSTAFVVFAVCGRFRIAQIPIVVTARRSI